VACLTVIADGGLHVSSQLSSAPSSRCQRPETKVRGIWTWCTPDCGCSSSMWDVLARLGAAAWSDEVCSVDLSEWRASPTDSSRGIRVRQGFPILILFHVSGPCFQPRIVLGVV